MDLLNILIVKTYNRIIQSETMYNGCNKLLSLHTYTIYYYMGPYMAVKTINTSI